MATRTTGPRAQAGARATYAAFVGAGAMWSSWAVRIPQIRTSLHLDPAGLGFVLLSVAVGSVLAPPVTGMLVHRYSSRRTVAVMAVVVSVGLATVCIGYHAGVPPVIVGFVLLGFGTGSWDVAMNVQGAAVERALGRAIMPRFHAGYSVGTVIGALIGTVMVTWHVPVTIHLLAIAVVVATVIPWAVRDFVPDVAADAPHGPSASRVLRRWGERRTILLGLFVLAFGFAEGSGNDWITVALIDGYRVPAAVGTLGLATFLIAMTISRWFGPTVLRRYGRVRLLRGLAVIAVSGLLLFVFSPVVPLAFLGALLWGTGISLGFPVGLSAAADDPAAAAGRVSVVSSIAYCAFLGGPPLIGFLGNHITVLRALTVLTVFIALSALVAGALAPLNPDEGQADSLDRS